MCRYVATISVALVSLSFLCFAQEARHFKYSEEANTKTTKQDHKHFHDSLDNHFHGHTHEDVHEHQHAHENAQGHQHDHENVSEKQLLMRSDQIWMETMGSVVLISLAPFLLLMFLPDLNKHQNLLKILLGFAAGGLLGDAFLHLIPHALSPMHSHSHEHHSHNAEPGHSHIFDSPEMTVPLWVIGGIFSFLCIDKFLRFLKPVSKHGHSHNAPKQNAQTTPTETSNEGKNKNKKQNKNNEVKPSAQGDNNKSQSQKTNSQKKITSGSVMQTAGYLNLAADFTHNFTDGIAIAGSFMLSRNVGFVTTLTVLVHELPHEIGDYAILIQSGCGIYKAMFLQLLTAVGAFLGAVCSLIVSGIGVNPSEYGLPIGILLSPSTIATRLLPLTAGGFIYIALVSVLPDLLAGVQESGKQQNSWPKRLGQTLAELAALILGVGLMVGITLYE